VVKQGVEEMSERIPGSVLAGKFFGFLLFIVGLVLIYNTWASMNAMEQFFGLFIFWGVILAVAGLLMILAKIER